MLAPEHPAYARVHRRSPLRRARVVAGLLAACALVPGDSVPRSVAEERQLAAEVRSVLPELRAFVERERGLPFLRPVAVDVLAPADFLVELGDVRPAEVGDDAGATLQGLGQLGAGEDLDELTDEVLDEGVVGFYEQGRDRLVLRDSRLRPATQQVLVHELVHALQDQHGLLAEPTSTGTDERALAYRSLVEGDATRVEQAWGRAQPPAVRGALHDMDLDHGPSGLLRLDELDFPYVAGQALVTALLAQGGQQALDRAYREPPRTTAQVLHPGRGPGRRVPAPWVEGQVVDSGVLGELGLASLLGRDPLATAGPQAAWDGDAFVTVERAGRTCTHALVHARDGEGRDRLLRAVRAWARDQPDADVAAQGEDGLRLRSCDV